MATYIEGLTALTGGAPGALDSVDGGVLADGDKAVVKTSTGVYFYHLNSTSGATESSPYVISPDSNAGTKRWVLQVPVSAFSHVRAVRTTAQSVPTSAGTTIIATTEDYDKLGEYDNSTGVFTAVNTGLYFFHCAVLSGLESWASEKLNFVVNLYKNGTQSSPGIPDFNDAVITRIKGSHCTGSIDLNATDYIDFRLYHEKGSAIYIGGTNKVLICIDRIA